MLVRFPAGAEIFLFSKVSTQALGPTQPSIQRVWGKLSSDVKRPVRENDRSPLVVSKSSTSGAKPPFPIRRHGLCRDN